MENKSSFANDQMKVWRRNVLSDASDIMQLDGFPTQKIFGEVMLPQLIERAYFSASQLDPYGNIITHVALFEYPNVSTVPPWDWLNWANVLYGFGNINTRNTLFIHHIAWDKNYSLVFLLPFIQIMFMNCSKLENLLMIVPPGVAVSEIFYDYFTKLLPNDDSSCTKIQTVYYCMREQYFPKLDVHMAVEEDNDDLAPIITKQNNQLEIVYGEYFMSELIAYGNENRKVLSALDGTTAVGVMVLTTAINVEHLLENFELTAYNGLHKPDVLDKLISKPLKVVSSLKNIDTPAEMNSMPLEIIYEDKHHNVVEDQTEYHRDESTKENIDLSQGRDISHDNRKPRRIKSIYAEFVGECPDDLQNELYGDEINKEHELLFLNDVLQNEDSIKLKKPEIFLPKYLGKENAFCIELLAIHEDYDERQAEDFLWAAFEVFPDYDYCLISLPFTCSSFPLIKYFERCSPRCHRTFPHELFLIHRNSALSELKIRQASQLDKNINSFLSTIEVGEDITMDFLQSVYSEDSPTRSFVVESEGCVIGLVIVQEEEDLTYIHSNYEIDKFHNFELIAPEEHGQILHMALSPLFQRHSKYILREVLRCTGFACLYYKLYPEWLKAKPGTSNIMNAIGEMMPVQPRRTITNHLYSFAEIDPESDVLSPRDPYALYMMSTKMTNQLSLSVNVRILVIGASEIALAYLESLLFSSTKDFMVLHNVTLVSPHGLPSKSNNHIADMFFMNDKFYTPDYLAKISLHTWVNCVLGTMTNIDRHKKVITVNYDTLLNYDYLVITCGEQFQDELVTPKTKTETYQRRRMKKRYVNSFCIYSHEDAITTLDYLKKKFKICTTRKIIVYGYGLDAYIMIAAFMESGYGEHIALVESFPESNHTITCFNNDEVYYGVINAMSQGGVKILQGYHLESWHADPVTHEVISVTFTNNVLYETYESLVFINCRKKCVDPVTFLAISQSSLVFNKYIVINPYFVTNDPNIISAGSATKYSGKYYAEEYEHRYYNYREIGKKMCEETRSKWDPSFKEETHKSPKDIILSFKKPLVTACKLPNGWNYLHVCKPGKQAPLNEAIRNSDYGTVLVTGDCYDEKGYFRLHFNPRNIIETITCYSKKKIDVGSIVKLYGKHNQLLNNPIQRFKMGCIKDFYQHFSQPWLTAIYYDRFANFFKELICTFRSTLDSDSGPLKELLMSIQDSRVNKEEREAMVKSLRELYKCSRQKRKIELSVLEFLDQNKQHFPMYAKISDVEDTAEQRKYSPFHYLQ